MKKSRRIIMLAAVLLTGIVMLLSGALSSTFAADDSFEKQLKEFPESYHPYLRELHRDYPEWNFVAFKTGLDWKTVIDNEHNDYALVYNPDAARIFKSLDADDYDAANDRFYYKDGSFVAASRLAVEYFMDPRNFLDKGGIFQFELLNFSSLYSVEMVDAVLAGSFMGNAKITWVDASGKQYTSDNTYAEVIYNAGKTYDINPCFLASKILNEVGYYGSDSVSGTHEAYPGYYNFYNIGATDGVGAIGRGLYWASGGSESSTTYSRPWTTPEKSIMGGAEFLAEEYIAAGQFTGYLQRFNVNSDSDYELFSHQYMSNLTGALSQGYSTYRSYRDMGILGEGITFSIPVFENMSNADGSAKLEGAETTEQYATVNRDYRYMRQGPSVDHDTVKDANGADLVVPKGTEVKILQKADTDAYYFEEILAYPFWYRISFTIGKDTYTGYIPASRLDVITAVHVATGQTDIALAKNSAVKNQIISSDPTMVRIIDSDTVSFLKNGFVTIYIYDSWGHIEEIRFKVGNYASYYTASPKVKVTGNKIKVSSAKNAKATGYGYNLCDKYGNIIKADFTTANSHTFDKLTAGGIYDVYFINRYDKYIFTKAVRMSAVLTPLKVENLDFTKNSDLSCTLIWDKVPEATGYKVAVYDKTTKKYTTLAILKSSVNSYKLSAKQAQKADSYAIRAYSKYDGTTANGAFSAVVSLSSKAPAPSGVSFADKTDTSFTLKWTGNELCDGYEVYMATDTKSEPKLYKTVTATSIKLSGFTKPTLRRFAVRSFINKGKSRIYSDFTPLASILTMPAKPQKLTLTASSTSIKASWDAVHGAKKYKLTYQQADGSKKTVTVTDTSYTLKSLPGFTEYSFSVAAVAEKDKLSATGKSCAAVKIKTLPDMPKNFKVSYQGYNHIDLTWDETDADFYRVYYYDASVKKLGSFDVTENSISIRNLSALTTYKFKIKGFKRVDGKNIGSDLSAAITSETVIPVVEGLKISSVKEKSFVLSWDKLEGAVNYNVYYKQDGKYKKIMKPKANSCTVTVLPASGKGSFCVTATFTVGDSVKESKKSEAVTAAVKPAKITGLKVTPGTDSVQLQWNKVENATGYAVYVIKNGKYYKKKMLKGTSYTLTGRESASSVKISVRAYVSTSAGNIYGSHVKKSFYTKPLDVTKITLTDRTDTSYTLNWAKSSEGVNRYYVYRYNESKKKYEKLAYTDKTSYTVKGLKPGTMERYTVLATVVKNDKVVTKSDRAFEINCGTYLPEAKSLRLVKATADTLQLAWNKVKGAEAYRVYYYSASAKKYKLYKEVTDTGITVDKLKSGKKYKFRVRAVKQVNNQTFYGIDSAILTVSTK